MNFNDFSRVSLEEMYLPSLKSIQFLNLAFILEVRSHLYKKHRITQITMSCIPLYVMKTHAVLNPGSANLNSFYFCN